MYGETFYGRHTAQHQLQWRQIKIKNKLVFLQLHSDVATDCEIMAFEYKHFDRIMFLKVSEKQVWANNKNTNQTAPGGLHCWMHYLMVKPPLLNFYDKSRNVTKPTKWVCAQQRLRSAWAFAQSDQSLRCPHEEALGP